MQNDIDWNGAAVFLGAFGAFCASIATVYMQVITWRDNRRGKRSAERRERTLNAVAKSVGVAPEDNDGKTS